MRALLPIIVLVVSLCAGCTSDADARRVLEAAGYSEITLNGYGWFACSDDDTFHTAFTAKGPTGVWVAGVVCSGWAKGSTACKIIYELYQTVSGNDSLVSGSLASLVNIGPTN